MASIVREAVNRLKDAVDGVGGSLCLEVEDEMTADFVLVRQTDLELLLSVWKEKKSDAK